jgi:hypothetical protein
MKQEGKSASFFLQTADKANHEGEKWMLLITLNWVELSTGIILLLEEWT